MQCPKCGCDTFVRDTRAQKAFIKRTRVCTNVSCALVFRTFECVEGPTKIGDEEPMVMSKSEACRLFEGLARVLGVNVAPVR